MPSPALICREAPLLGLTIAVFGHMLPRHRTMRVVTLRNHSGDSLSALSQKLWRRHRLSKSTAPEAPRSAARVAWTGGGGPHFYASLFAPGPSRSGRGPQQTHFCVSLFAPGRAGSGCGPRRTHVCVPLFAPEMKCQTPNTKIKKIQYSAKRQYWYSTPTGNVGSCGNNAHTVPSGHGIVCAQGCVGVGAALRLPMTMMGAMRVMRR